ncbi:T9SS type A sorting domain-containing protein [Flavobacterium pallidum]|uniref:Uncharacterized protein n=1 Tax=Flavobacterium pallidum TaxID=2172098 RepID=A0A2S1SFD1_9FLAO|nr:T9SS type A sorting domain-containing protein [Flavobacterium pallidum]AWI25110.1 hypothetical protein HYN49_03925 [Flavobacterium pallidum]
MRKIYLLGLLMMIGNLLNAQIQPTSYRGAFAPAPAAMWTDSWTNYDPQNTAYPAPTVTVNSAITTNTTWTSGNTYLLSGLVYVKNGATLTIQPGTKILGDNSGSALVITRGAKINATGTAASPIVFTSDKSAGSRNKGDWGGIILLGKGSFNINGGVNNIEGITASADTQYGGGANPDDNDNSGTLKYVRIEFGGYVFAPNNEINGLTFGAVGRGTTIDYVQVSFSNDDAFEWFGGSVNCKHLVSYRNLDDDFDTDNGFNGNVQFALSVRDPQIADAPAVSTSEGFESDNNATGSTVSPFTSAIFSNLTMVGPTYRQTLPNGGTLAAGYKRALRIRRASQLKIYNSVFMDYLEGLHIDGIASENAAVAGTLRFNNNVLAGITTTSKVLQITAPGTITSGNNASFNMTSWYAANGNTTVASNSGLLTNAYDNGNAFTYTGLDYRPASGSILLSGASFTDAPFNGKLEKSAPTVVSPVNYCRNDVATPLSATLAYGGTQLRWYASAGSTTPLAGTPTPMTNSSSVGTRNYYVAQVYPDGLEGPKAVITVNVYALPEMPTTLTGTTVICNYIGSTETLNYTTTAVSGAASYSWTLPVGATLVSTSPDGLTATVSFQNVAQGSGTVYIGVQAVSVNGCKSIAKTLGLIKILPTAPASISGATSVGNYVGTSTAITYTTPAVANAQSYLWTVPAGVDIISGQGSTSISVNFLNASTAAGSLGVISVKSVAPCGMSPARNLSLFKALPARPANINASSSDVCVTAGPSSSITYSIAPIADVTTYNWTIPTGATIVGNAHGSTITVNYTAAFSANGIVSVSSVNNIGSSAARNLTVYRNLPANPSNINGRLKGICPGDTYSYSFANIAAATSYTFIAPAGAVIKSANFPGNATNSLTTSENAFTVTYPGDFVSGTLSFRSSNGCGMSVGPNNQDVAKAMPTPTVLNGPDTVTCAMIGQQVTYTTVAAPNVTSYVWIVPPGTTIVSGQGTASLTVIFNAGLPASSTISVQYNNACNGIGGKKKLTLTKQSCTSRAAEEVATTTYSELYPNPASEVFNIDIKTENASETTISVYSFSGNMVSSVKHQLNAGENTVATDISRLPRGIYIVKFTDPSSKETETKKLIKK